MAESHPALHVFQCVGDMKIYTLLSLKELKNLSKTCKTLWNYFHHNTQPFKALLKKYTKRKALKIACELNLKKVAAELTTEWLASADAESSELNDCVLNAVVERPFDYYSQYDYSPLLCAIENGCIDVVKLFYEKFGTEKLEKTAFYEDDGCWHRSIDPVKEAFYHRQEDTALYLMERHPTSPAHKSKLVDLFDDALGGGFLKFAKKLELKVLRQRVSDIKSRRRLRILLPRDLWRRFYIERSYRPRPSAILPVCGGKYSQSTSYENCPVHRALRSGRIESVQFARSCRNRCAEIHPSILYNAAKGGLVKFCISEILEEIFDAQTISTTFVNYTYPKKLMASGWYYSPLPVHLLPKECPLNEAIRQCSVADVATLLRYGATIWYDDAFRSSLSAVLHPRNGNMHRTLPLEKKELVDLLVPLLDTHTTCDILRYSLLWETGFKMFKLQQYVFDTVLRHHGHNVLDAYASFNDGETLLEQCVRRENTYATRGVLAAIRRKRMLPVLMAASAGNEKRVSELLDEVRDRMSKRHHDTGESSRHVSGKTQQKSIVRKEVRDEVNFADDDGNTALHHAARGGHTNTIRLLLTAPFIDAHSINARGKTPAQEARQYGFRHAFRTLENVGSSAKKKKRGGR